MISSYEGGKYLFLRTEKEREQKQQNSSSGGGLPSLSAAADAAPTRTTLPSR